MISNQAREGFDNLLIHATKAGLVASADDVCEVAVLDDCSQIKEKKMVVLTVSSYLFRLVVLLYFNADAATREHVARSRNIDESDMEEQDFYDSISEFGNICCGTLNRGLAPYFPHIGMSTPNIIDKYCSSYLNRLNCGYIKHFRVDINDSVHFHIGLCVSDYDNIDFVVEVQQDDSSTGELEMF